MIERHDILDLIPHQGAMCLLDSVLAWDEHGLHAQSRSHRDAGNPLRGASGLRGVHLCEYGAQAMAVHGGLLARRGGCRARPGLLVALRDVHLERAWIGDDIERLEVCVERQHGSDQAWQYVFRVEADTKLLASGRATVMLAPSTPEQL